MIAVKAVRAVLADAVVEDATIVVDDGVIVSLVAGGRAPPASVDGQGAFCLPGLVDTHSDGLEKELRPRPGVELPIDFAVRSFEGRVRAAGVTTVFHGVGFENGTRYQRSVEQATTMCDALEARMASPDAMVDHRILYRLDARDRAGFAALVARLGMRQEDATPPLVSFEDHTPGQGQYTDRSGFERYLMGTRGLTAEESTRQVDELIREREARLDQRSQALPWLTAEAAARRIRLMAHDPATADDVHEAVSWHAVVAEFPTTLDAARLARDAGLRTVCGAPNVLQGGSHAGNVSAEQLISCGLCDGLASDYLPSTMLGAVGVLVQRGTCTLSGAVALVTSGPAETVGLSDRGRLAPSQRGDLVLVTFEGRLPTVRAIVRAAEHLPSSGRPTSGQFVEPC